VPEDTEPDHLFLAAFLVVVFLAAFLVVFLAGAFLAVFFTTFLAGAFLATIGRKLDEVQMQKFWSTSTSMF